MARRVPGTCVPIECMVMGFIDNNVYIVDDGSAVFVVDPTTDASRILAALGDRALDAIVITHGHWDHTGAANELRKKTGAQVIASATDAPVIRGERPEGTGSRKSAPCPVDVEVEDGDVVELGSMRWHVLATPGHTPGCICLFLDPDEDVELVEGDKPDGDAVPAAPSGIDPQGAPVLISGDTLFAGTHGRTDFVGGSNAQMAASLKRLAQLPGNTIVLPGHNDFTTIAREATWINR